MLNYINEAMENACRNAVAQVNSMDIEPIPFSVFIFRYAIRNSL